MSTPAARPRATDDQRHQATEELGAALSRGQLTIAEFEERTMAAIRATYADELPALLADVPAPTVPTPLAASAPAPRRASAVRGSSWSVGVFGGTERSRGALASTHRTVASFGGVDIDLRNVELSAPETVIQAVALFGGITIKVFDDVEVICEGLGLFGSFSQRQAPRQGRSVAPAPAGAPRVRITGLAAFGRVDVQVYPRG